MQNRRNFLSSLAGIVAASSIPINSRPNGLSCNPNVKSSGSFNYCLNTSTIRGQKLGLLKDIEIAAKVGYNSVELWLKDIRDFISLGGNKMDIKKKLNDLGLTFENSIAFTEWIVDDEVVRQRELNQFQKDLELLSELGCKRIAASPMGATNGPVIDLFRVAERYGVVLNIGKEYGITPVLEVWGHSTNLHALGQAIFVAIESNHPDACLLLDIYHLHRGGSGFSGLRLLGHNAVPMFHFNDYPGNINRADLTDADRVLPGDGSAPFTLIVQELKRIYSEMVLSLELFNTDYWKMDALTLARLGLQKMKKVVNS